MWWLDIEETSRILPIGLKSVAPLSSSLFCSWRFCYNWGQENMLIADGKLVLAGKSSSTLFFRKTSLLGILYFDEKLETW